MSEFDDAVSVCQKILREHGCQNLARLIPRTPDWNRIETLKVLLTLRKAPAPVMDAVEVIANTVRENYR